MRGSFSFAERCITKGELGKIQFLQASHQQDMDGWPNYWPGLPPMHYATHCVGPCLALTRAEAEYVSCFGSGTIRKELIAKYNSPFAVETCHIKFARLATSRPASIRSLFDSARQYRESIDVYGSKKTFEWPLIEGEEPVMHTAKKPEPEIPQRVKVPDYAHLLPEPIRRFTTKGVYDADEQAASVVRARRRATAARIRTWCTSSSRPWSRTAIRSPTPCNRPTGPASASWPTNRP